MVRLIADKGKMLTDGETFCREVCLPASARISDWHQVDEAEAWTDMRYSVRSIIREVRALGLYDHFRALLEQSRRDWDFIGANYIARDDEDFIAMSDALVAAGIIERESLDEMLTRCVWSAE